MTEPMAEHAARIWRDLAALLSDDDDERRRLEYALAVAALAFAGRATPTAQHIDVVKHAADVAACAARRHAAHGGADEGSI